MANMEALDRGAEVVRNSGADLGVPISDVVNILPLVIDEELYNKCLFKTISLHQLKLELKRRNLKRFQGRFYPCSAFD